MRQVAAILVALLLFFNWFGYRLVSDYLQRRADSRLEARLDANDYDESKLVEIRVPINLPYQVDWQNYERCNGEIDVDGVHYKFVKRKVERGEVVLLCLPNAEKQMIRSARDEFFKLVNDLQQGSAKKHAPGNSSAFKNLLSEYRDEKNDWTIAGVTDALPKYRAFNVYPHTLRYFSVLENPPDAATV